MKTILSIILLIVFGVIASFLFVFIVNIAGLPGALLAGMPDSRSKRRFIFGSIVSALGQSYIYLAFTAFVVNWTILASNRDDVVGFVLYPFAFLATLVPVWMGLIRSRVEARGLEHANAQVEAMHITFLVAFLGFFVFMFAPSVIRFGWGWVPYVD